MTLQEERARAVGELIGRVRAIEAKEGVTRESLDLIKAELIALASRTELFPATHFASRSTDSNLPPMGMRVRLRADFDTSKFPRLSQVLLQGLKTYGMLLADNGGDWFVSGAPDARWDDEAISTLKRVKVRDFEVVDTGPLITR